MSKKNSIGISAAAARKIIEDMLKKFPKGPNGILTKDDYYEREEWDPIGEYYRHFVHGPTRFGYSSEELLATAMAEIGDGARHRFALDSWARTVRFLWPDVSKLAVTRRARRLYRRIGQEASTHYRLGTSAGIYKLAFGHTDNHMYAWGENADDAKIVAGTMCGHAFNGLKCDRARLWSLDGPSSVTQYNDKAAAWVDQTITARKEKIASLMDSIGGLEARKEAINGFSALQLCALLDAGDA